MLHIQKKQITHTATNRLGESKTVLSSIRSNNVRPALTKGKTVEKSQRAASSTRTAKITRFAKPNQFLSLSDFLNLHIDVWMLHHVIFSFPCVQWFHSTLSNWGKEEGPGENIQASGSSSLTRTCGKKERKKTTIILSAPSKRLSVYLWRRTGFVSFVN